MKSGKQQWTGRLSFTTLSGVKALIRVSKGTSEDLANLAAIFTNIGAQKDLVQLDLISKFHAGYYDGADVKISVKGTGTVDVGNIFAQAWGPNPAINLGTVEIDGDLGSISVGTKSVKVPALIALKVRTLGHKVAPGNGPAVSQVEGFMHTLIVTSNIENASFEVTGNLKKVKVGGSLIGCSDGSSGRIACDENIDHMQIKGDIQGGSGLESGLINCKNLKTLVVGGSLIGGPNTQSGCIYVSNDCGIITIKKDVVGSSGIQSGSINVEGTLKKAFIGGSFRWGQVASSGAINQKGGTVTVLESINP